MTAQRPSLTSARGRIKVDKNIRRGRGRAHRKGESSMSYGRIGVIGAMDSELAALVKKPDKTDKSVFQSFLMAMIRLRAGAYPSSRSPAVHLSLRNRL